MSEGGPTPAVSPAVLGGMLLLMGAGLAGYLDLRDRIAELRDERATAIPERAAASAAPDAGPPDPGPAPQPPGAPLSWDCEGRIGRDALQEVVGRHGQAVFACYEARRAERPELEGELELRLLVASDGRVRSVQARGPQDADLSSCASAAALRWQLPAPQGGECAVVSVPFLLAP